jgi:ribosome biogenesis GTPase
VKGLVIKNTGSWYTVLTDDGDTIDCKIKGKFRLKGIRSTNPVAVGDRVSLSLPPSSDGAVSPTTEQRTAGGVFITEIEDRRNYVIRKSSNLSKQSHILAANVDQVFLIVTVNYPETSTTFIDRFLASAEAYRIPVVLIFNKTDLLSPEELHYQEMMMTLYDNIGYQCVAISAKELEEERGEMREERGERKEERDKLEELLKDKITLFSGNSGVGKSTLLNKLIPGVELRTAEISDAHNTGMHTTTFSEMLRLPFGGWAIDTPGIKGFGTFDMEPEELSGYFREIFHFSKDCRFSNCTHTHEPGCAVLKAVEEHYIAQSRYQSYLSMLEDKEESKYREAF